MKEDNKYVDLIASYLSGNLKGQDKKELFDWVEAETANKAFFDEMANLWAVSAAYHEEPFNANLSDAWLQIDEQLEKSESGKAPSAKIIRIPKRLGWRWVAAVTLLFLTVSIWQILTLDIPQMVNVQTYAKEQLELDLPDGSKVWLNENTTISYDSIFSDRLILLNGEAFFDVKKQDGKFSRTFGTSFEIVSGDAKTTVLGTKFNVRAYAEEDQIEVTVEEGRVVLAEKISTKNAIQLKAGDSGILKKEEQQVMKTEVPISNANAWRTKELIFDNITLKEAIPSLERYFGIKFQTENDAILNCHVKSDFHNSPELKVVISTIQAMMSDKVIFEEQNSGYLLKGEGCKN